MGMGPFRRRQESRAWAEAKLAAAKALIAEADQRWHGMAAFLARTGMDHNAELVGRRRRQRHHAKHAVTGSAPSERAYRNKRAVSGAERQIGQCTVNRGGIQPNVATSSTAAGISRVSQQSQWITRKGQTAAFSVTY
jgi:hypothetical protein